jgi:hypothetical protein
MLKPAPPDGLIKLVPLADGLNKEVAFFCIGINIDSSLVAMLLL